MDQIPQSRKWWTLGAVCVATFMLLLDITVVNTALPAIQADLGGSFTDLQWVIDAYALSLAALVLTAGSLADRLGRRRVFAIGLGVFAVASLLCAVAPDPTFLNVARGLQGIGGAIMFAVSLALVAQEFPSGPERGMAMGIYGGTIGMAVAIGPLVGGLLTDGLGWRWCFYIGVPVALAALVVLQRTLRLPVTRREVRIDWPGALLVSAAVSLLLVWVTLAGDRYAWASWQTAAMVGGSLALAALFLAVEARASDPIIPLRLFRDPTIALASGASLLVGVAMFSGTVFFSQYFQLARGDSATMSGVLTIPLIAGLVLSSTVSGQFITRTGRWKNWLVAGGVLVTAGMGLLGTTRHDTPYLRLALFMALMGLGLGALLQNLVLATQNRVGPRDLGAASSVVAFFRSFGGALGVSALGALLAARVADYTREGVAGLGGAGGAAQAPDGSIPDPQRLPAPLRAVIENAYGHGIGDIFLYAAPTALLSLLIILGIKETALKTRL